MDNPTPANYLDFLCATWAETIFFELRLDGKLAAVAITDVMQNGLSAVYSFYDPALPRRSLGRQSILLQVEEARLRGLTWLYLGYWIRECRKMNYKEEYRPLEYFIDNEWRREPA